MITKTTLVQRDNITSARGQYQCVVTTPQVRDDHHDEQYGLAMTTQVLGDNDEGTS